MGFVGLDLTDFIKPLEPLILPLPAPLKLLELELLPILHLLILNPNLPNPIKLPNNLGQTLQNPLLIFFFPLQTKPKSNQSNPRVNAIKTMNYYAHFVVVDF
jgi:hypothetical protein